MTSTKLGLWMVGMFALALVAGCSGGTTTGGDAGRMDAGTDGAMADDTGTAGDTGVVDDTGTDGGTLPDGSDCIGCMAIPPECHFTDTCHCTGMVCSDTGVGADSGTPDAGTDAGSTPDAGNPTDAGIMSIDAGDCRSTSCPRGQACMPCRGVGGVVYVCLPSGVVC
jgi:hypothetical protein